MSDRPLRLQTEYWHCYSYRGYADSSFLAAHEQVMFIIHVMFFQSKRLPRNLFANKLVFKQAFPGQEYPHVIWVSAQFLVFVMRMLLEIKKKVVCTILTQER